MANVNAAGKRLPHTIGTCGVRKRGERRQIIQRKIHLGYIAAGTDVPDTQGESRIELRGIDQIEERALGIDAGDDGFGGDFFAVGEDD